MDLQVGQVVATIPQMEVRFVRLSLLLAGGRCRWLPRTKSCRELTQVGMGPYQIMMLGLLACFPFCESSAAALAYLVCLEFVECVGLNGSVLIRYYVQ